MSNPIVLNVDQQNQKLVAFNTINGLGVSVTSWPKLFQGSSPDVQIGVVNPTGSTSNQYAQQILATSTIKVTICAGAPKGDGSQTVVAGPTVLSWSAGANAFIGTLSLTLAALATAMGVNPTLSCTLEIELVTAAVPYPIWQELLVVYAPADANAVVTPNPPSNYQTAVEAAGTFVAKLGQPGDGFILTSPDGTQQKFIGLANDGTLLIQ